MKRSSSSSAGNKLPVDGNKKLRLGLLSEYKSVTSVIENQVISIEKLMQQPDAIIISFFNHWLEEKKHKTTPIDIPISTTKQPNIPNFLQLAVRYDQSKVVGILFQDSRTQHLIKQLNHENFNLMHIAAQFNSVRTLEYLHKNNLFNLTTQIDNPDSQLHQATVIHVAAYHGSLAAFNYSKTHMDSTALAATTANDENIAHLAAGQSKTNILKQLLQDDQHDILHYLNENIEAPVHAAINNNRPPALQFFIFNDHSKRYTSKTDLGRNIAFYATNYNIEQRFNVISCLFRNEKTQSLFNKKNKALKTPFENLLQVMGYYLADTTAKQSKNKQLLLKVTSNYYKTTVQNHASFSNRLFCLSDENPSAQPTNTTTSIKYDGPVEL